MRRTEGGLRIYKKCILSDYSHRCIKSQKIFLKERNLVPDHFKVLRKLLSYGKVIKGGTSIHLTIEAEFLAVTSTNRFYSPPPPYPIKSGLKLVCNVNIVYGNLKSEISQDFAH
jgi:hypothetical protein